MSKSNYIIDVDSVIEKYNANKAPEEAKMSKARLAKIVGCGTDLFTKWRNGVTPNLVDKLVKLLEVSGDTELKAIIKPKENVS